MSDNIDGEATRLPDGTLVLPLPTVTAIFRQIADGAESRQSGRAADPISEIRAIADQIDAAGLIDLVGPSAQPPATAASTCSASTNSATWNSTAAEPNSSSRS
ncbi:hypothetical protein ADK93_28855 [Streptomyces sp. XY58]|nr:hypothetical protein VR43_26470 [Streptomyces sp. NRRL S-104]KOU82502.1 hypothetical protein ADK93_28855 [Streptomyces sp. XY58]KOV05050.1 hypothetical protein ADK89_20995 [Streptomyces sp. XY37]KOV46354.1 hypothetical protein ADK99_22330 [Streptomyces sp. MMG1064]